MIFTPVCSLPHFLHLLLSSPPNPHSPPVLSSPPLSLIPHFGFPISHHSNTIPTLYEQYNTCCLPSALALCTCTRTSLGHAIPHGLNSPHVLPFAAVSASIIKPSRRCSVWALWARAHGCADSYRCQKEDISIFASCPIILSHCLPAPCSSDSFSKVT